jgi:hypothetical protein
MIMPQPVAPVFTGPLTLTVRDGRDWATARLELTVGRHVVEVRHLGRLLAVLDRDRWRTWLLLPEADEEELAVDDVRWTRHAGLVRCWSGRSGLRLDPADVEHLRDVI